MITYQDYQIRRNFDGLLFVALAFIVFAGVVLARDIRSHKPKQIDTGKRLENEVATGSEGQVDNDEDIGSGRDVPPKAIDNSLVEAPYDHYTLTQGPHGYSYGHMAIDISAGKGAIIKSPIGGNVTELYVDEFGNPTLVIENDLYQVTMLHGKYKVKVGERVEIGQMVGRESNMGNTMDMWGRSCRDRDCGYHTHLNIFDKRTGSNINPLTLIEKEFTD